MHMRVVYSQGQPGKIDEAVKIFQANASQALKGAKGFKHSWVLVDRKANKGITLSLWESEADANAYQTNSARQELLGKLASVLAGVPTVETYEVAFEI